MVSLLPSTACNKKENLFELCWFICEQGRIFLKPFLFQSQESKIDMRRLQSSTGLCALLIASIIATVIWITFNIINFEHTKSGTGIKLERNVSVLESSTTTKRHTTNGRIDSIVRKYHEEEEKQCRARIGNRSGELCPCVPLGLLGRVYVNTGSGSDWEGIYTTVGDDVLAGGEWRPKDCVASVRLALVIPFRDREAHLRILLRHLYPILKRQLVHFRVFVVEQRSPSIFNKAAVMNAGYLEARRRFDFDCVVFHDVDMLLEDDRALLTCGGTPRHYARAVQRLGYSWYPTFGGVTSITPQMLEKVNGFPIRYFGWGGEDDDMWSRVKQFWKIFAPPAEISRYSTLPHSSDATNVKNEDRIRLLHRGYALNSNHSFEGMTDLRYEVNEVLPGKLYTRIEVDINTTNLQYPKYHTYNYTKVHGACLDAESVNIVRGISWLSCRFLCDTLKTLQCVGYSHDGEHCKVIKTPCVLNSFALSWTYFKEPLYAKYFL